MKKRTRIKINKPCVVYSTNKRLSLVLKQLHGKSLIKLT